MYTPKNSNNSELNIKSTTSLSTLKDIFIVNRLLPSDSIQDPNELDETENFSTVNVASSIKDSIQNNANIPQANKIIDYLKSNPNKLILFAFKKHSFHYQIVEDMIKNNEFEWDKISKDNIYTLLQQGYDIKMSVFKSMLDKANDYFQNGLNESSAKVLSYLLMNFSNFNTSEQKQVIIFILDNFKTEDYSKLLSFINKKSIVYLISIAHISNAMTKQFLTNIYQAELPENYNEPEKFDSESMYSFHEYEYKDKDSEYTLSPDLNRINNFDTKHHNEIINYLSNRDEYLSNILDLFIENNYKEVSKDRELRTIKDTSNLLNFIKNTKYSGQIYGTNLLDLLLIYSPNSLGKQIISTFSKDNEYSMESVISSFIFLYKDYDTTPRIYDLIESNYNYVFSSEQFVSYINNKINNYIHNSDTIRNLDAICEIIKVHSNNDVKLKIKEAASKIYVYYPKTNDATKDSILQACNI